MEMRTAILFSGTAYNYQYSIDSLMKNLVLPNNSDVFILTSKMNSARYAPWHEEIDEEDATQWHNKTKKIIKRPFEMNAESFNNDCKNVFGDRLKKVIFIEDIEGYQNYIESEEIRLAHIINEHDKDSKNRCFEEDVKIGNNVYLQSMVFQYNHVKKCFQIMQDYEKDNGFLYDYVARIRIDFIVPEEIKFSWYYLNQDYPYTNVFGSVRVEKFEWMDEFAFFIRRDRADQLFLNLDQIGFITQSDKNTISPENKHDHKFAAETQFSLLLYKLNLDVQQIKIWRSGTFTKGNDGNDYFNYKFSFATKFIEFEYGLSCISPTDINEHLPILKEYGKKCNHITELGTRFGNSAVAFMASKPKKFITYDVANNERIDYLKMIAKDSLINMVFKLENPSDESREDFKPIEKTDLLFIDTNHHKEQCEIELRLHARRTRKYIIFHDTETFWEKGQGHEVGGGLKYAIEPFMINNPHWKQVYRSAENNGLLILKRKGNNENKAQN